MKKIIIIILLTFSFLNLNAQITTDSSAHGYIGLGIGSITNDFAFGFSFVYRIIGLSCYFHHAKAPETDLDSPAHSDYSTPKPYEDARIDYSLRIQPFYIYKFYPFMQLGIYQHKTVYISTSNVTGMTAKNGEDKFYDFDYGLGLHYKAW